MVQRHVRWVLMVGAGVVLACNTGAGPAPASDVAAPVATPGAPGSIQSPPPQETGASTREVRVAVPQALQETGGTLTATRLHPEQPAREQTLAVAPGQDALRLTVGEGEALGLNLLGASGEWQDAWLQTPGCEEQHVSPGLGRQLRVPRDYPTLQSAVDAAQPGDTVRVDPGVYTERVRLRSGVRLLGAGADKTVLDGQGVAANLVDFTDARDVVIAGFTFRNVGPSEVCPRDVLMCGGTWYAAGVYADGTGDFGVCPVSTAVIAHNLFEGNAVGVMLYFHARAVVRNNAFVHNENALVLNHFQDVVLVTQNVFWENPGYALAHQAATADVVNNVFARSGVGIFFEYVQQGRIRCNLFFENGADWAQDYDGGERLVIGEDGNVSVDPLFESPGTGDFRLRPGSPAIDRGCYAGEASDPDGSRQDIGLYGGPLGRWP